MNTPTSRRASVAALFVAALPFAAAQSSPAPSPSSRQADAALAAEIEQRFGGDRAKFLRHLREQGKTVREFRRELEGARTTATAAAAEKLHLRLIQIDRRAGETDEQLLGRVRTTVLPSLRAGEPFADVAKRHSQDAQRAKGGDWGWVTRTDLKPEFAEIAFALNAGEISSPLLGPGGCFILFVEARQ